MTMAPLGSLWGFSESAPHYVAQACLEYVARPSPTDSHGRSTTIDQLLSYYFLKDFFSSRFMCNEMGALPAPVSVTPGAHRGQMMI